MTHFKDIARQLAQAIDPNTMADIRIYANSDTIRQLPLKVLEKIKSNLLTASEEEDRFFRLCQEDWDERGLLKWMELMQGGALAEKYLRILYDIWGRFPFDVILYWGENGAVKLFSNEMPVVAIAMELGCTRPPYFDSLVLDLFGTNGNALIPKLFAQDLSNIVGAENFSAETALLGYSENLESLGYEKQYSPISSYHSGRILANIGRKVAFIPLQLYDDANLILFSKFKTLSEVVLEVVPKLAADGYLILIKPHPSSKYRGSAQRENTAARACLREWESNVIWCDGQLDEFNNAQLISFSDIVVTVNSSVGFEAAAYYNKPVVVMGSAIYKPMDLFPDLEQILDDGFDFLKYQRGIAALRKFMLECYLVPGKILKCPALFYSKLLALSGIQKEARGSPVFVARRYYQAFSSAQRQEYLSSMVGGISRPGLNEFSRPTPRLTERSSAPKLSGATIIGLDPTMVPERIVSDLVAYSRCNTKEGLISFLTARWLEPDTRYDLINATGLFDPEFYLSENRDVVEAGMNALGHFTLFGESEGRSPNPKINLREYLRGKQGKQDHGFLQILKDLISSSLLVPEENRTSKEQVLAPRKTANDREYSAKGVNKYLLTPPEKSNLFKVKSQLTKRLSKSGAKIAIVAHIYYSDLVPELLDQISNVTENFDLIVTLPDWGVDKIKAQIKKSHPNVSFCCLPNRGRDIGPFLEILPILLQRNYDAILKIQTKRGYYLGGRLQPELGKLWRKIAFNYLLGSPEIACSIIAAFRNLPDLLMVGPEPFYLPHSEYPYHDGGKLAKLYIPEAASKGSNGFFAGTMFWFRPSCLRPLVSGPNSLSIESFEPDNTANDGQAAHLVERIFGQLASGNSMGVGSVATVDNETSVFVGLRPNHENVHEYLSRKVNFCEEKSSGALMW